MNIRPARVDDVPAVHKLIQFHAEKGKMILRSFDELYANLREFFVCENENRIAGCTAVHIFSPDWAELKCLAVEDSFAGRGMGRALCDASYQDMNRLGVRRLFALTSVPVFFEKVGYRRVTKESLPHFIWGECVRCPSFPVCNEEALVRDVNHAGANAGK